ncbi:MurR/RpiR family transcriptional regulator [Naasia sp. SYSU D00948]|uniref:MurR/RpiR family transcriptional regulator n=1 Tax=Naasia sp. SYSU D00948 TaxID=2817379 RepID=UPI001B30FCEB|nr:MurR/RpiR family transcriptional regulator [Naasia sp. SYSU D00948]
MTTLSDAVASSYGDLSPQEQRVADLIRARPDEIALYSSAELARLSGVSKATVSRLYRRLGFSGSREVRDLLRAQRGGGVPVDLAPGRGVDDRLAGQYRSDVENLTRFYESLDAGVITDVAARLAVAKRVLVVGHRSGFPVALHLRQQLAQVRDGVRLAPEPGQSVGEELEGLESGDVVVLLGFQRRPAGFLRLLDTVAASPATGVLVTDPSGRRYDGVLSATIEVPTRSPSAFDSYAVAGSLVSVLAGAVLAAVGEGGAARVSAIDRRYTELGELEVR